MCVCVCIWQVHEGVWVCSKVTEGRHLCVREKKESGQQLPREVMIGDYYVSVFQCQAQFDVTVGTHPHQTCKSLLLFLIFVSDLNLCSHYLSVQECAAGFYRLRSGFLASAPASRVPTATGMASCVQCQCSGHSSSCDPETSICQVTVCVCGHSAAGDHPRAIC